MIDISFDDLMKQRLAEMKSEDFAAKQEITPEAELAVAEKKVVTLTPEERKKVDDIKKKINVTDTLASIHYGSEARSEISKFSSTTLGKTKATDAGKAGELLTMLTNNVRSLKEEEGLLSKIPLINNLVKKGKGVLQKYETVCDKVDFIQAELEKEQMTMMKDIVMFDALYEKNLAHFKELQLYITAGEEAVDEMRTKTLPRLREDALKSGDQMAGQVVRDFENQINSFEKHVHDLKVTRTVAIQQAPQIRLIQNNAKMLVERIQSAISNTIPLWKNQIVIALGQERQREVLEVNRAINDTTNDLLRQNAEALKMNSLEIAVENERAIVDVDTLQAVNENLISTIEETIKIQNEGKAKRAAAEVELQKIEERLKNALMQTSQQ